jgi:GNAT superfamily N-acetyltransferase
MFVVRRASESDAISCAAIHLAALTTAMPFMPRIHTVKEDQIFFAKVLASQECWVMERRGVVLGFIAVGGSWVNHLYVLPNYQGIGVGTRLLEMAKELSPKHLELWTFQENLRAREFYGRHGFIEVELTDGAGNEERTPDVRLVWHGNPVASLL